MSDRKMAPQVLVTPRSPANLHRRLTMKSLAHPAHPITRKITTLEERCHHELMSVEERLELRERILRLKAKARAAGVL
jgi:hypothetical protein